MVPHLALALAMVEAADAPAACLDRQGYQSLRYDEDFSKPADTNCRRGAKYMPLGSPDRYLSLGGELRARVERTDEPRSSPDAADATILGRVLVHADLHVNPSTRIFLQAGSYFAIGRNGRDGPTDEDRLDLAQGFIDLSGDIAGGRATLRSGRQEATFGSARLVSLRESPNVRRAFDGARAIWRRDALSVDAFYLRPIALRRGVFDDATDDAQELYGVYVTTPLVPAALSADLYYLGYRRKRARFEQGLAFEDRHSLGIRLFGARGGADWDIEAVYQYGSFGGANLSAWTIATDVGFIFDAVPWRPRLGLKADVASGDGDPTDDTLGTFNALYPRLPYFTEAGLVAPANIMDIHPTLAVSPASGLSLSVGANLLWLHRSADAFYAPPLVPVATLQGRSRYVGTQAELNAAWQASRHIEVKAWVVRFFASDGAQRIGVSDATFQAASIALKF